MNCAGLVRFTPVAEADEDEMDMLWRVNVAGMARVLKAARRTSARAPPSSTSRA